MAENLKQQARRDVDRASGVPKMLDFMVIGLPRSGTTWASVWLDCQHDPLYQKHYSEWDAQSWRGVSCTGIWRWPEWVNKHPARKLVVYRDRIPRQHSLDKLFLPFRAQESNVLNDIRGLSVNWSELFDPIGAKLIWEHLRPGLPFDAARHNRLRRIRMTPELSLLDRNLPLQQRLQDELGPGAQ